VSAGARELIDELIDGATALDVALEPPQAQRLLRLLEQLALWNTRYNLTAITVPAQMVRAHLLDSLAALPDLQGNLIADAGTGAGFPGLPLALVCPQRRFTLIDATAKKIRFVSHAARLLGAGNVTALHARVETLHPDPPFDTVLARAYAALPELLRSVAGLCGPGTRVVALKGRYPDAELGVLPAGWRLLHARAVRIPGLDAERHILSLSRGPD
jgi:16S rRNA (guanine527-N7)-methyltransferase